MVVEFCELGVLLNLFFFFYDILSVVFILDIFKFIIFCSLKKKYRFLVEEGCSWYNEGNEGISGCSFWNRLFSFIF